MILMQIKSLFLIAVSLLGISSFSRAQNLPSLITGRNINSTFSITAYDPQAKEWGIAVATNNIYVGNSTCFIQPGIGAFSVIAETEPAYGINGLEQLKQGKSIEQAITYTREQDSLADYRQVSGIDAQGNTFAFTGSALKYWKGKSTQFTGKYYAVMGNQLAPGTLDAMAGAFERSTGTLAERLLKALIAGEKAGGQISGKQSAALLVKGIGHEWYNQIDLRVDHSRDPFADLQRLLNYHYGRIRINQATFALNNGHQKRGDSLLNVAVMMTKGWYGIYPRIAKAYLRMGKTQKALELIKAAVKAEPKWKENLSAFYMLYSDPELQSWYPESNFTLIDWNNAIDMLISLDRNEEAMTLARRILKKHPESSYTWYLLACAYQQKGSITEAREADSKALRFDPDNGDARRLAAKLSDHI
jgi:uncharacterized Ntn-hydrolase superfamily protein